MDNHVIFKIAEANSDMSDVDRLVNLYWSQSEVLLRNIPGSIVELGCNRGMTSVFLQMIINHFDPLRELHVFDSFEGLPEPGPHDRYLNEGDVPATVEQLAEVFQEWGMPLPVIHKGWFEDTLPTEIPDEVAFAYVDCDFYESTRLSLEHVYPRLSSGAVLIVDDYADTEKNPQAWAELPAVKMACDEFFADKPERLSVLVGSGDLAFGYFRKA